MPTSGNINARDNSKVKALRKIISHDRASIKLFLFMVYTAGQIKLPPQRALGNSHSNLTQHTEYYIQPLKNSVCKTVLQVEAKKIESKRQSHSFVAIYYQLNGSNVLRVRV